MGDFESGEFMKSLGGGVVANLLFLVAFIAKKCLDKKVKHSECSNLCCSCETDLENTMRQETNPYGERSHSEEKERPKDGSAV